MATQALRDFLKASGVLNEDGKGYNPEILSVYMAKGILNPFLLGDFERSTKIAIQYAENLLSTYMFKDNSQREKLSASAAKILCDGYYDHSYPINRREAREKINLSVVDMPDNLWNLAFELMIAYDQMRKEQNIANIIELSRGFQVSHWQQA